MANLFGEHVFMILTRFVQQDNIFLCDFQNVN